MIKTVICTSSDHRHRYFAETLAGKLHDIRVYSEELNGVHDSLHFSERLKVEREMLSFDDQYHPSFYKIKKGDINSPATIREIIDYNPSLIITYGCSILTNEFISRAPGKKINVHLGLSPYYRGTATNFWPIYNHEMQYCGVTFHELTTKVDGGDIFGQYSLKRETFETVHHVGNSLIRSLPENTFKIITNLESITTINQLSGKFLKSPRRYYRQRDFENSHADYVSKNFRLINDTFLDNRNNVEIVEIPK